MATVPSQASAAVGGKIAAATWNDDVKAAIEFFVSNRPLAFITQSVAQSLTTATSTPITFTSEVLDRDAQHSTSSNTSRVVIGGTLGWYLVTGIVAYAGNATGDRRAWIALNGTAIDGSQTILQPATAGNISIPATSVLVQATVATDYVELFGYQNSGGALNTVAASPLRSSLTAVWMGA